jgi:predicted PurR-regulated permease PerM
MARPEAHLRTRLLNSFAGVAIGVLVVAALYFAQSIVIPVALAVFLSFLMAPVVFRLQPWVGRPVAVGATLVMAAGLLVGVGWAVTHEMSGLIETLGQPQYARNIGQKVESVERWFETHITDRFQRLTRQLEAKVEEVGKETAARPPSQGGAPPSPQPAAPATSTPAAPPWLSELPGPLARTAEGLAQAALVVVLVAFMLLRREDLRNRIIRLIGHGRLTITTMALDDAAARISRYLFVQLLINTGYGLVFAAGLRLLGVPYAFLWGFLAAVMRYVPYAGIWLAILPPIVLSLAASPGWTMPLWVIGLVIVLEIATANFVEPVLFGQSIGVSEVALLVSAAFWAWLWGPVGLVLSAPMTVCLVVLGKHVPQLEFFDVLLGDAPALPDRLVFYQRLLSHDQDEAAALVEKFTLSNAPERIYDEFLIPALVAAKRDREHRNLADADERFIIDAVTEMADQIAEEERREPAVTDDGAANARRAPCLLVPARDPADEAAVRMLRHQLKRDRWEVDTLPAAALAAEMVEHVRKTQTAAVCIAVLPPGGLAHCRYLCKRLRQCCAETRIAVGLWGTDGDLTRPREMLAAAGADRVATTLLETKSQLAEWLPVLAENDKRSEKEREVVRS